MSSTTATLDDDLDFGATLKGFSPGQKLSSRYALDRILGKGGMGVVWLVKDEELNRDIAMKFLPEMVIRDKEAVADLKRETNRSLELTHANIVRIYDFVQGPNWAGITMERVDGETLSALKLDEPGGCFDVAKIEPWIKQLCQALSYAHEEARVVHRDLKPSNLMVTSTGKIKVTDFGISGTLTESVSRVSMRPTTSGTLVYMSPQQAMGEPPSATDDIYSMGATIYDLLTGKPPFYQGDVIKQVREKECPSMTERRSRLQVIGKAEIPAKWEAAIAACLHKDDAQRPQSIAEFSESLFGVLPGVIKRKAAPKKEPGKAPPQPQQQQQQPQARPPRAPVGLIAAAIALVAIIAVAIHFLHKPAPPPVVLSTPSPTPVAAVTPPPGPQPVAVQQPSAAPAVQQQPAASASPAGQQDLSALDATALQQLAQNGNAAAEGLLALWYANGIKTQQDYQQAFSWASAASNAGDPVGKFALAVFYYMGNGVVLNKTMAAPLATAAFPGLTQLANQGNAAAAYCLAGAYMLGLGTAQDAQQALTLLQKYAASGDALAEYGLGWLYATGTGTGQNWQEAATWFQKAADQGHAEALLNLALMYENGKGVAANQQKAVNYWQQAAQRGNAIAQTNLGRMYRHGDRVPEDLQKAVSYYQQAANQGNAAATIALSWMYANGEGVPKDTEKAAELSQKATILGYPAEQLELTSLYATAISTPPAPLDPQLIGTWNTSAAGAQTKWVFSKDGQYLLSGAAKDAGVAGGSDGLIEILSVTVKQWGDVDYDVHGSTLYTYSVLGPSVWHRSGTSNNSDDNSDNADNNSKQNNNSDDNNDNNNQPSGGNDTKSEILNGLMRSHGFGGF